MLQSYTTCWIGYLMRAMISSFDSPRMIVPTGYNPKDGGVMMTETLFCFLSLMSVMR